MIIDVLKIFIPSTLSFFFGIGLSLILNHYLYKYKMWKKRAGKKTLDGADTPIFNKLHEVREVSVPKMGGILIWASPILTVALLLLLSIILPSVDTAKLLFLSRGQTWLPFATLILGGLVGLIDDYMEVRGTGDHVAGGLSLRKRLLIVSAISLLVAFWFYIKLETHSVGIPFFGEFELGWLFIPLFLLVTLGIYSGGVIDGIDGLAGGIFAAIFSAYAGIAFFQQQIDLAAFCMTLVGAILAFLWFNIPPARFYMSETGSMALTITLAVVAFLTDSVDGGHGVFVLPIIALPLVLTTLSNIIQILSKRFRKKKVFLVAPLHHHFEAIGWPAYKVTMRYWVIGIIFAIIGMMIGVIG
ncbi:MAG: hypothetical protein A2664_03360 [Candidatus Taylorbacteria bacterium RIFCSPHIGHO2_01_FULL_46_22b]|uniref:Phospho-N-acetylmuramoyl-pentapeptide-transferase n=1 Tax=Candidatus Taylorbacteria bacterium RIFCSPHIGHO2_01_FULL_46_22b TaxID=1802301 RepID=A0A1G2M1E9_9BACT|nr:MAG: hypothetical protein A2664_03360 [Candidatus Taylorbacteria bacterium RIFCSPHIGHO2_01_FULL_46_22b]